MIPLMVAIPLITAFILTLIDSIGVKGPLIRIIFLSGIISPWLIFIHLLGLTPLDQIVGGWQRISGIEVALDSMNIYLLFAELAIFSVVALFALIYFEWTPATERIVGRSILPWKPHVGPLRHGPIYPLMLLMHAGAIGALISRDLFNFFVYLEIAGVSAFIMVAYSDEKGAKRAAYRYLLYSITASFMFLMALGILYMNTGYLNIQLLQENLVMNRDTQFALWIIVASMFVKVGLVPLHLWQPKVHSKSHVPVAALISGIMVTLPMYRLILIVSYFDGISSYLLMIFAFASIFFGMVVALFEYDVFRLLAYCTISQMGFILLGIASSNYDGALDHLFTHMLVKVGLFLGLGAVIYAKGSRDIRELNYRDKPILMGSIILLSLSLGVVYPLLGSYSLGGIIGGLDGGTRYLAMLASIGTLVYYIKLNHHLIQTGETEARQPVFLPVIAMVLTLVVIIFTIIYIPSISLYGIIALPISLLTYILFCKTGIFKLSWQPIYDEDKMTLGKEVNIYTTLFVLVILLFLFQWF